MSNERVDVLAVMDLHIAAIAAGRGSVPCAAIGFYDESRANFEKARAAVAELIEADHEYEAARRDWDHVTAHDPEETSDETWRRVADRFEVAVMRRIAALSRIGGTDDRTP